MTLLSLGRYFIHKSYTRIEYFLISSELISKVVVKYQGILIPDHIPVVFCLKGMVSGQRYNWQINPSLLKHLTFKQHLNSKRDEFLAINDNNARVDAMGDTQSSNEGIYYLL